MRMLVCFPLCMPGAAAAGTAQAEMAATDLTCE